MASRLAAPLLGLLLVAAAPPPPSQAPSESVAAAKAEEQAVADALVAATAKLRQTETDVTEAAQQVTVLAERRRAAERDLQAKAAALGPLLPLAERLGLFPAETLLAVPAPPEQAIRGLAVLHGLMRTIEQQAAALRQELAKTKAARQALDAALSKLRAAQADQARQAAQLDQQLAAARAHRAQAEDAAAEAARRAAAEATRAQSVRAAIAMMAASRAQAEQQIQQDAERARRQRREAALAVARRRHAQVSAPAGPGLHPGGAGILPVVGPVVRRWGEQTEAGPAHGISFRAPPKGRVVSPCSGRVAFAGPFRSYGVLIILNCGGGYHFVLAGLGKLDVDAGEPVRQGEPLGVMPDWDPASAGPRPALYVELRREGEPVDPAPFLRAGS